MSKPNAKAVLMALAKLGGSEFSRSDVRFAAFGDHREKQLGGKGVIRPVLNELKARDWLVRVAHNRYCITERGWAVSGIKSALS